MTSLSQMQPPPDADQRRAAKPVIVYALDKLPAYDAAFYDNARAGMAKIGEMIVPPREGRAFDVPAGHFFRIVSIEGPQVGDLNLWSAGNLAERFFSGKTRALNATHVTTGSRLWSTLPYLRPMATVTHDTLAWYGFDADGAGFDRVREALHHRQRDIRVEQRQSHLPHRIGDVVVAQMATAGQCVERR